MHPLVMPAASACRPLVTTACGLPVQFRQVAGFEETYSFCHRSLWCKKDCNASLSESHQSARADSSHEHRVELASCDCFHRVARAMDVAVILVGNRFDRQAFGVYFHKQRCGSEMPIDRALESVILCNRNANPHDTFSPLSIDCVGISSFPFVEP